MITYQVEEWPDIREGIKPLTVKHWEEIGVFNKEKIPLNPNWELYDILYEQDVLHIVTAEDNKKLVGYYVSIITPYLHYKDTLVAENDVVYLCKEYRKGLTGYKLIKFAVEQLKQRVQVIILNMKAEHPFFSLSKRLGFKLTEYKFTLEI